MKSVFNFPVINTLPLFFRIQIFQLLFFSFFLAGAFLGIAHDQGNLISFRVEQFSDNHASSIAIIAFCFFILLFISRITPKNKALSAIRPNYSSASTVAPCAFVLIGFFLLLFNLLRLDVFDLLSTNPGAIAFNLAEAGGAVIYFSTMSIFFVGTAFLLDISKNRFLKIFLFLILFIYTFGVALTTRRELVIISMFWLFFYHQNNSKNNAGKIIFIFLMIAITYIFMLLRGIDMLEAPLAYFATGEFEPFRFAIYLVSKWLTSPEFENPFNYALPLMQDGKLVGQVNSYFSFKELGVTDALGLPTVTIFSTIVYMGFIVPLIFYILIISMAKSSETRYKTQPGYLTSFIHSFTLVKLLLFLRNGELLESFIDLIVLHFFFFIIVISSKLKIGFPPKKIGSVPFPVKIDFSTNMTVGATTARY